MWGEKRMITRIWTNSFNGFVDLVFPTLPHDSKTDCKRDIAKDYLTCLALFECETHNILSAWFLLYNVH